MTTRTIPIDSVSAPHHLGVDPYKAYGGSAPETYERYFVPAIGAPLAADLLQSAHLRPGERVIDLACGTGIVARLAAQQVGPSGSVTGVDMSPGMLTVARSVVKAGVPIEWHESRAEHTGLPNAHYHAVLCQLGLMFFADKPAALHEIRRMLVPGGRLVANTPGPTPPLFQAFEEALAHHLTAEAASFVSAVFSLHDTDVVRNLVLDAGFESVSVERTTKRLHLPAPADFMWQYIWCTPLAGAAAAMDDAACRRLQDDVVARWERFTENGALMLSVGVSTVTGR